MFLTSAGVDWARTGLGQDARLNPYDPPMSEMIRFVIDNGGQASEVGATGRCAGLTGGSGAVSRDVGFQALDMCALSDAEATAVAVRVRGTLPRIRAG